MARYGMVIDTKRCVACHACTIACKQFNHLPNGVMYTNVLTDGVVKEAVEGLKASPDFLGQFAVALAEKWSEGEPPVISSSEADSLKAYFAAKAKALLDKGVTINKVNGKDTLLTIAPADGSYKVNFGKEEFETYFKNFLRPQLVEMLF